LSQEHLKLHVETAHSAINGEWTWRVRSNYDRVGSDFLATGSRCKTLEQAQKRGEAVRAALVHTYPFND
jgi:hypothetical protein